MLSIYATLHTLGLKLKSRTKDETGATAVEYGIMVGLIAVVIIAVVATLGPQLRDLFQQVVDALPATT